MEGVDNINKRETGIQYEQAAADFLKGMGYSILKQNYYCRYGEIDIIAEESRYIVFIYVLRFENQYDKDLQLVYFNRVSKMKPYQLNQKHNG